MDIVANGCMVLLKKPELYTAAFNDSVKNMQKIDVSGWSCIQHLKVYALKDIIFYLPFRNGDFTCPFPN